MPEHLDLVAAAVVIAGAIFNSGIMFATVRVHGKKIEDHEIEIKAHGTSITKLLAWHDGFTAGAHRG